MGIKKKKTQEIPQIDNGFCDTCARESHQKCNCNKGNKGNSQSDLNETAKYWANISKKN